MLDTAREGRNRSDVPISDAVHTGTVRRAVGVAPLKSSRNEGKKRCLGDLSKLLEQRVRVIGATMGVG